MTPLPLLLLLLKLPRSPPPFQETALGAVASQVQHLGKKTHAFWQSSRFFYLANKTTKQLLSQCSRNGSYKYEEENRKPPGCAWNWARCRWECGAGFSAGEGQPWELFNKHNYFSAAIEFEYNPAGQPNTGLKHILITRYLLNRTVTSDRSRSSYQWRTRNKGSCGSRWCFSRTWNSQRSMMLMFDFG